MSQQTKKINSILTNEETLLGQLIAKASALNALEDRVSQIVSPNLKGRFKLGNYDQGVLTFLTDNSATATEFRYQIPELLKQLRTQPQWAGLVTIKVKVHQHWHTYHTPPKKAPEEEYTPISQQSIAHLKQLAEDLNQDPKNKEIVESLNKLIEKNAP